MERLTAGGLPIGTTRVDLSAQKRKVLKLDKDKKFPTANQMLENLRSDGVYVDDPQVMQKFTDINT